MSSDPPSAARLVFASAALGVKATFAEFALGHPFDAIKTKVQAQEAAPFLRGRQMAHSVWTTEGVLGFYSGGIPNLTRMVVKNAYRTPTRPAVKCVFASCVPNGVSGKKDIVNVATGATMACIDGIVLTPMERVKVWMMTVAPGDAARHHPPRASRFRAFVAEWHRWRSTGSATSELTRGMAPTVLRGVASWCSYLAVEERADRVVRSSELYQSASGESVSLLTAFTRETIRTVVVGFVGGAVGCAASLPFDNCKTRLQKCGSSVHAERGAKSPWRLGASFQNVFLVMRSVFRAQGVSGLCAGWTVRMPHYILVGAVQSRVIPAVDEMWGLRDSSVQSPR